MTHCGIEDATRQRWDGINTEIENEINANDKWTKVTTLHNTRKHEYAVARRTLITIVMHISHDKLQYDYFKQLERRWIPSVQVQYLDGMLWSTLLPVTV